MTEPVCPAASAERATLSLNREGDMRCAITGLVQAAAGSPCCGRRALAAPANGPDYWECAVWRKERERHWEKKHAERTAKNITAAGTWA